MRVAGVWLALALLAASLLLVVSSAPTTPSSAAAHSGALGKVADAVQHSLYAEQSPESGADDGASLHRVTQRALEGASARASGFVAQLGSIVSGLKAKSHLARLRNKYALNATELEQVHRAPSTLRRRHHHRRQPEASNATYALHPINLAPKSGMPSGLNFTTWVYPTKEGNVTLFIGIVDFPFGKYHIYPSPRPKRDAPDEEAEHDDAFSVHAMASSSSSEGDSSNPILLELAAEWNPLCDGIAETSVSARFYGCQLAQNLGFFDMSTNACLGNVVSDGQWINRAKPDLYSHAHFGITAKASFVTGYLTPDEAAAGVDGGFLELAQGSGWLVRNGKNHLKEAIEHEQLSDHFVMIKAPRNALAHDRDGRLWMFQADGEEDVNLGLTLPEFADILTTHFPIENAVNVDGGGSSTTVYEGEVADRPTCRDTPDICERAVTTISCLMH